MEELTFADIEGLEITGSVTAGLSTDGFVVPTQCQLRAIPSILAGKNVVVQSGTGTGKTLAYLLPVLQRLREAKAARAVVVSAGVELAMQILRVAGAYKDPDLYTLALVATGGLERQRQRLKKRPRLIVGTPGRILEFVAARKLKGVNIVVIDEPDPVLAGRDGDFLREFISRPDPPKQLVVAAATLGPRAQSLCQNQMGDDVAHVRVGGGPLHTHIQHCFVSCGGNAKYVQLGRFIESKGVSRAIVFVNDDAAARHLFRYLGDHRLRPQTLTKDRSRSQRQEAIGAFRAGAARVLIATDAAARGLDVPDVEWVLHYDLPSSAEAYVHRAGRTGRAGARGRSVAFVEVGAQYRLARLVAPLQIELHQLNATARGGFAPVAVV